MNCDPGDLSTWPGETNDERVHSFMKWARENEYGIWPCMTEKNQRAYFVWESNADKNEFMPILEGGWLEGFPKLNDVGVNDKV